VTRRLAGPRQGLPSAPPPPRPAGRPCFAPRPFAHLAGLEVLRHHLDPAREGGRRGGAAAAGVGRAAATSLALGSRGWLAAQAAGLAPRAGPDLAAQGEAWTGPREQGCRLLLFAVGEEWKTQRKGLVAPCLCCSPARWVVRKEQRRGRERIRLLRERIGGGGSSLLFAYV